METEAARNARQSLELAFQISSILGTGLDRHTLSILIALCDRGLNPDSLVSLIREFSPSTPANPNNNNPNPNPATAAAASKDLSSLYSRIHLHP